MLFCILGQSSWQYLSYTFSHTPAAVVELPWKKMATQITTQSLATDQAAIFNKLGVKMFWFIKDKNWRYAPSDQYHPPKHTIIIGPITPLIDVWIQCCCCFPLYSRLLNIPRQYNHNSKSKNITSDKVFLSEINGNKYEFTKKSTKL